MKTVKEQEVDAKRAWQQFEDEVVPRLGLTLVERAVYSHLLRHSRLEGRRHLKFSIAWLARGAGASGVPTRQAVRRLVEQGALRLIRRSHAGHVVEVRLPEEMRPDRNGRAGKGAVTEIDARLDRMDFMENKARREAIHARERGLCFYCLRVLEEETKTLDHVVPRMEGGRNSHRNLVSCCADCNCYKSGRPADEYLRRLYRDGRLTAAELGDRLRALKALVAGRLRLRIGAMKSGNFVHEASVPSESVSGGSSRVRDLSSRRMRSAGKPAARRER